MNLSKLEIDYWCDNTFCDIKWADTHFDDLDLTYRGWIYNADNKIIGDYECDDSVLIEKLFGIKWEQKEDINENA